ncbi:glycerol uptake facilitator-like aquaporin [Novosphingobium sp. SG707]|nr:glycerol uptake facilitator-like aquaporin [Novosphingobium sp. SG707]
MFGLPVLEFSTKARTGMGQWVSEAIARAMSNTFAGIAPAHVPGFVIAQILGALAAKLAAITLFPDEPDPDKDAA